MVTGIDESASAPHERKPGVDGGGWTFDEDVSWGYDAGPPPGAPAPASGAAPPGAPAPPPAGSGPPALSSAPDPSAAPPAAGPMVAGVTASAVTPADVPVETATPPAPERPHPGRMVLGLASIAAERLRGGVPAGNAILTGVGLMQQGATNARGFARRTLDPAARFAADTVELASKLPGAGRPLRSLERSRARWSRVVANARVRGDATVAAGRADAEAFVRNGVAETMSWAQAQAIPQIVDGLVPHMVDEVVPRILEGTLPEIRARVMPAVIDDLTHSPQVRELMMEQGRGVVGEAAEHLRSSSAAADDRLESAFRRLVRAPAPGPGDDEPTAETPVTEPPADAPHGG